MSIISIKDKAVGRWRSILPTLGVSPDYLTGKHMPCPCCGGKDRFRFTDRNGSGSYFCNGCGAGSGVDLVMKINKLNFVEAVKQIEGVLPSAAVQVAKPEQRKSFDPSSIWKAAHPIEKQDPVGKYLAVRGLPLDTYPTQLRFHPRARYGEKGEAPSYHPAMIAKFVSPDTTQMTIHITYLTEDGGKADVAKSRRWWPGPIPKGGAIRLSNSDATMGVAEGIETAMSASALFGMPVWATGSAGNMSSWEPPPTAKQVVVFADHDTNGAGQHAAWALACRLRMSGTPADVRWPDQEGSDWNDEFRLLMKRGEQ